METLAQQRAVVEALGLDVEPCQDCGHLYHCRFECPSKFASRRRAEVAARLFYAAGGEHDRHMRELEEAYLSGSFSEDWDAFAANSRR